jgi:hypothetical protein
MKTNNLYLPVVFLLVIFAAIYLMYSDTFSTRQVDLGKYLELCQQYQSAANGEYSADEINMLVAEVNYLLPDDSQEISGEQQRALKTCINKLVAKNASSN